MNIFILSTDPAIAASYHCDQHISKMILESAQMLSTVARHYGSHFPHFSGYYKPTHLNHPCNEWLREGLQNCAWLISLCEHLDDIRMDLGANSHRSMNVIRQFQKDFFSPPYTYSSPKSFIFAGPGTISIQDISIPQKYQAYYQRKHSEWTLDKGKGMSYKNRPVPYFMQSLISDTRPDFY